MPSNDEKPKRADFLPFQRVRLGVIWLEDEKRDENRLATIRGRAQPKPASEGASVVVHGLEDGKNQKR